MKILDTPFDDYYFMSKFIYWVKLILNKWLSIQNIHNIANFHSLSPIFRAGIPPMIVYSLKLLVTTDPAATTQPFFSTTPGSITTLKPSQTSSSKIILLLSYGQTFGIKVTWAYKLTSEPIVQKSPILILPFANIYTFLAIKTSSIISIFSQNSILKNM